LFREEEIPRKTIAKNQKTSVLMPSVANGSQHGAVKVGFLAEIGEN
jgi:hypothetical protein